MKSTNIFLIDGIGAVVSALFLGVVLVHFEDKIGMPKNVLYILTLLPIFFALYSFGCYFLLRKNFKPFMKSIAILNMLYCCLTLGILFFYDHNLSLLGWAYFIIELIILTFLIQLEFKASEKAII